MTLWPGLTINHVVTKVSSSVNLLKCLSPAFTPGPLPQVFILPLVDYCDVVWNNCTQHNSSCLQFLFNYACRLVLHRPCLSYSAFWKELGLSSLAVVGSFILLSWPVIYQSLLPISHPAMSPNPLPQHMDKNLVNLPTVRMTFGQYTFAYAGASLWCSLPASLRESGPPWGIFKICILLYWLTQWHLNV